MICRLCLQNKPLCKRSHIIPDFMYQELFDEKHLMISFVATKGAKAKPVQSGKHEPDLLCAECDNGIIGKYEGYASKVLFGGNISASTQNFKQPDGLEFLLVQGLDYQTFKLFLISLVWRASISKSDFFNNVNLGPHEEKMRLMLLNGDVCPDDSYPVVIFTYRKSKAPKEIISSPRRIRLEGIITYMFLINGFVYLFKITTIKKTDWILEASLNKKGELRVIHATEDQAQEIF